MKCTWMHATRAGGLIAAGLLSVGLMACNDDPDPIVPEGPEPDDCDPIDPYACSLPWPSNHYLAEDASRVTGYTLTFGETSLPSNARGVHIDPSSWLRMDGYGVSTPLIVRFEDLDYTGLPDEYDIAPSLAADAPIRLFEVGEDGSMTRVPYFVEPDLVNPNASQRVTWIRPAVLLDEATRYVVAIQGLRNSAGELIEPSEAFQAYRDGNGNRFNALLPRYERFEEIFDMLAGEGVVRGELQLAWDFVTASSEALHGPMIHMRDDALAAVGELGPEMTITDVIEFQRDSSSAPAYDEHIAFRMEGTFRVPYYMRPSDADPELGTEFNLGEDGLPAQNGEVDMPFWIMVPWSAVGEEAPPAGIIAYGHGLNGQGSQVYGGFNRRIANTYNYIMWGVNWTGMSSPDVPGIISMVGNFSNFPWLVDRMHQGVIEFVLFSEAMANRFPSLEEVTDREIQVDPSRYYYSGISQGGIYGGTFTAVSQRVRYGHLGVPGQNYSLLLQRSVDFDPFFLIVRASYRSLTDVTIVLAAIQTLWDQVDPSSYYRHLEVDPFPGNEPSYIMSVPAKGDWQVSVMSNLIAANSNLGLAVMENYGLEIEHWGLSETPYVEGGEPYRGSSIILYDLGNPWPAPGPLTPFDSLGDPHGIPRFFPAHQDQMMHFFENDGEVIDVCEGRVCSFRQPEGCTNRECWELQ